MSLQIPSASSAGGSPGEGQSGGQSSEEATTPPTKGRSHESIWKRSKKILGVGRFEFLRKNYTENTSDKDDESKNGVSGKPAVSKRREQVRRAQKTHRQRTEHYIKALEEEVLRLQKVEEETLKLKQQKQREDEYVRSLELQVVKLQTEESANFLSRNAGFPPMVDVGSYTAKVTMSAKDKDGRSTIHAEIPQHFLTAAPSPVTVAPANTIIGNGRPDLSQSQFASYWDQLGKINSLANHQSAIDFVLFLEFGCMGHVHEVDGASGSSSGHILTTSASLMEQAPHHPVQGPATWNADCSALDRLFLLSSDLDLVFEITPIQAWNEIWKHPDAYLIQYQDLENLKHELRKLTACFGFGGVIDTTSFSSTVEVMFAIIKGGRNG